MLSLLLTFLTLPPFQGFSSGETDFHFHQFLSNFLRYSFSNVPLSHPYNIFTVNFSGSFSLLKFLSSVIFIFSYLLTSTCILPSNSSSTSSVFPKSSFFFQVSCSTVNPLHCTKYFSTPLIFLLFNIFLISHSLTPSISIGFPSFFFCPPTCSLYHTI